MKKIVMFIGGIETQGYFSLQMKKAFEELGHEVCVFDYEKSWETVSELIRFCGNGNTVMITFNFHGICGEEIFRDEEGNWFWDGVHVPCYNIIVDHPLYYHKFIEDRPQNYIHLSIDKNHEKYVRRFFPDVVNGPFLPLAGTELRQGEKKMPIKDRPIDVCFAGNYSPASHFDKYVNRHGSEYAEFYRSIIDELLKNPHKTMEEVAEEKMHEVFTELTEQQIKETMPSFCIMDLMIRGLMRERAVQVLVDSGIKVHLVGAGWEELECEHPENMVQYGPMNSEGCLEIQEKSKICLNVMPWFKQGAHDRIFNTMLNGGVCVTDSSEYLDEVLTDKDVAFFSLKELDKLPEIVKDLLANPNKMQEIADHGYETALKYHSWAKRAEVLHNYIEEIE